MVTLPLPRPTRVVIASPYRGLHEGAELFDRAVPDPEETALASLSVIESLLAIGEPNRPRRRGREPGQWTQVLVCVLCAMIPADDPASTTRAASPTRRTMRRSRASISACATSPRRRVSFGASTRTSGRSSTSSATSCEGSVGQGVKSANHQVILHELVHSVQHNGRGAAPVWLTEGVADWCRLNAGLGARHWQRQPGGSFENGYECGR